jgi:hypothetical protein
MMAWFRYAPVLTANHAGVKFLDLPGNIKQASVEPPVAVNLTAQRYTWGLSA